MVIENVLFLQDFHHGKWAAMDQMMTVTTCTPLMYLRQLIRTTPKVGRTFRSQTVNIQARQAPQNLPSFGI